MANVFPKQVKEEIVTDWLAETWKCALLKSTFTYDHTTDIRYANVSADEVSSVGYTAGGSTLTRSGGYDGLDYYLNATDISWTGVTFPNVRYVVVYETADNKIRGIFDLDTTYSCTNSTFTVVWDADGLIEITS